MSNFEIVDNVPARFENDFRLVQKADSNPSPDEMAYVAKNAELLELVNEEDAAQNSRGLADGTLSQFRKQRAFLIKALRTIAEQFAHKDKPVANVLAAMWEQWGRYRAACEQISGTLFSVFVIQENNHDDGAESIKIKKAVDLQIVIRELPPPDDNPSPEKQKLFAEIDAALTVVKTVCQNLKMGRSWSSSFTSEKQRASELLDEQVRKLAGVGRLGLVGPHTALASLALVGIKRDFVAREAGRIKNAYAIRLGISAGIAALIFITAYALIESQLLRWPWGERHSAALLSFAGATMGTWLSFSIRRVQLSFEQLGIIEEDLLDPGLRVIFVIGLTLSAYLLFWTGALNLTIGNLDVSPAGFNRSGSIALLLGVFCGLSERTMANAISGRAEAFIGGIAGGR